MSEKPWRFPRALAVAAVALGLAGGSYGIAAAASGSSASSGSGSTPSAQAPRAFDGPAHGTAAHEDAEKPVTGDAATNAQAAAVKAVGGGTAGAVTTDYAGTGYEVTVTKSDGSTVEVHLDSSFNALRGPGGYGLAPASSGPSA